MLAEREVLAAPDQDEDFAALAERREATVTMGEAAVGGELGAEQAEAIEATLRICERVLRRKRALG
jgi:hypothetical protein